MAGNIPERIIVCFGNSYTEGFGAERSEAYPALLQAQLEGVRVINAGMSGETAEEALGRMDEDVLSLKPWLVLVEFGTNESFRGIPVEEAWKNLEEIVNRVKDQGALILIVGTHFGNYQENFDRGLQSISRRYGTGLILGVLDGILSDPNLTSDPYHPNREGYRIMMERILPEVRRLLKLVERNPPNSGA